MTKLTDRQCEILIALVAIAHDSEESDGAKLSAVAPWEAVATQQELRELHDVLSQLAQDPHGLLNPGPDYAQRTMHRIVNSMVLVENAAGVTFDAARALDHSEVRTLHIGYSEALAQIARAVQTIARDLYRSHPHGA